jgi:Predicted nucleotidyltransferases
MNSGWQYRAASTIGVALLTAAAVVVVNSGTVQAWLGVMPVLSRLPPDPPGGAEYLIEVGLTVLAVTGAFLPLYKPRPRRILDIVMSAHKRVFAAVFALATIGYFDYTYKLPRLTLVATTPILLVLLPSWLVWLRRPDTDSQRTIIVGDDFEQIARITQESDLSLLGYLCPTPILAVSGKRGSETSVISDGGHEAIQPDSDLDILVAFDKPVTLFDLVRLENELTEELGIGVDLVTKDSLKPRVESRVRDDLVMV